MQTSGTSRFTVEGQRLGFPPMVTRPRSAVLMLSVRYRTIKKKKTLAILATRGAQCGMRGAGADWQAVPEKLEMMSSDD
jgi:hypothetical protein